MQENTQTESSTPSLSKSTKSTILVMACTLISRLLGFVRNALITRLFGARGDADVLWIAYNIPNSLRKLLAEGAFSTAFIPVVSKLLVEDSTGERSRLLIRNLIGFLCIVIVPLCMVGFFFPVQVTDLFTSFENHEQTLQAAALFRYFIFFIFLISISSVLMGVLNAHHVFAVPALSPVVFSISVITSMLLFHNTLGLYSFVVGVLGGGLGMIFCQVPLFLKKNYSLVPSFNLRNKDFRFVLRKWLPAVLMSSLFTINTYVANYFASGLEAGSLSAIQNAIIFWQLPFGLFYASITTVLFPRMARQLADKNTDGIRETVSYGIRFLFSLLIPSGILLILMNEEVIGVAFINQDKFGVSEAVLAAKVLVGYSVGLFSVGGYNFLLRYYYSKGNFKIPAIISTGVVILDIILSFWLKETRLQVTGLAYANSISFTAGLAAMYFCVRKETEHLLEKKILKTILKVIAASVVMGIYTFLILKINPGWWETGQSLKNFGLFLLKGIPALIILIGMFVVMKVEVVSFLLRKSRRGDTEI